MIKIKFKDLKNKSKKELLKMKKQLEIHLLQAQTQKKIGDKGFNIKEEKKNIARINTILNQKNGNII